jgi:hypothetical protein
MSNCCDQTNLLLKNFSQISAQIKNTIPPNVTSNIRPNLTQNIKQSNNVTHQIKTAPLHSQTNSQTNFLKYKRKN